MTFTSFFSGSGGFDIGFAASGFRPNGVFDLRMLPVQNSYHQCVSDMVHFVMATHGMGFEEANLLVSLAGDLWVCNVVSWLPIFRMAMPRHLLLPPEQLLRRELGELPYPEAWVKP